MEERPILFKGEMVRAILSGQKTQTRRVVNPSPDLIHCGIPFINGHGQGGPGTKDRFIRCPYGQPGDRLWVRETIELRTLPGNSFLSPVYRADGSHVMDGAHKASNHEFMKRRVHSSIHMPRWACRIVLEIVSVRVERLNDISEADAGAEGIDFMRRFQDFDETITAKDCFEVLWESINGPESWQANPWVWVVEFKRVQQ